LAPVASGGLGGEVMLAGVTKDFLLREFRNLEHIVNSKLAAFESSVSKRITGEPEQASEAAARRQRRARAQLWRPKLLGWRPSCKYPSTSSSRTSLHYLRPRARRLMFARKVRQHPTRRLAITTASAAGLAVLIKSVLPAQPAGP
jgi:hypothetical protein